MATKLVSKSLLVMLVLGLVVAITIGQAQGCVPDKETARQMIRNLLAQYPNLRNDITTPSSSSSSTSSTTAASASTTAATT